MYHIFSSKATLFILMVNFLLTTSTTRIQKTYKIESIRECRDQLYYAISQKDFMFGITGGTVIMNSTIKVLETIEGPLKHIINIRRCDMDFTGCGNFNELGQEDLCPAFSDPIFAQMFYTGGSELFRCPIQKGTYLMYNTSYNVTPIIQMPAVGYRWYAKSVIMEVNKNRTVYCVEVHSRIILFKSRKSP